MNVLLIGNGGREHALAWKIKQSKLLKNLYILPGNGGTASLGFNISISIKDHVQILSFCIENKIDLAVIGPEQPLVDGLSDYLRGNGILVFGPNKNAARIESEKSFSKWLMSKYNIPTACYKEFNCNELEDAISFLSSQSFPVVIKANGLAAGKGVLICNSFEEAKSALNEIFVKKIFGSAGTKIIIEEFMHGQEASIFAVTDGRSFITLPAAQDHKRIGDADTGKNTGGMGAYAPAPIITSELLTEIEENIIKPTIKGLEFENAAFSGCLYCGLMITSTGPKVVEFNCRFGDPETQVVLPLLKGDFLELLYSSAIGNLNKTAVTYNNGCSVCVVAASNGYPDEYKTGFEITGIENILNKEVIVFHAGTKSLDDRVVTCGGRVLAVTSFINEVDLKRAINIAYQGIRQISFDNIYFRKDIASKAVI